MMMPPTTPSPRRTRPPRPTTITPRAMMRRTTLRPSCRISTRSSRAPPNTCVTTLVDYSCAGLERKDAPNKINSYPPFEQLYGVLSADVILDAFKRHFAARYVQCCVDVSYLGIQAVLL